ncbi:MAG: hypothetical protein ACOC2W_03855 [bacterium]
MKKKEAFEYMERELGYVPTKMLFNELYSDDDDDIPMNIIEYWILEENRQNNKQHIMILNAEVADRIKNII